MATGNLRDGIGFRMLMILAALVVVVAGLKALSSVLLPVLIAVFLAVLSLPPVTWLQRHRVPDKVSVLLVFAAFLIAFFIVSAIVGNSIQGFVKNIPDYQSLLQEKIAGPIHLLEKYGIKISDTTLTQHVDVGKIMSLAGTAVGALGGMLSNMVFVLLTVAFIMGEITGFPRKLRTALGDPDADLNRFARVIRDMNEYLKIKALVSVATALFAGLLVYFVGVDYPILWALVAFLLNFVPTLGSIVAAVPPVLLALIQFGWERSLIVLGGYVLVNMIMGNVVEPRMLGRRLGLSTLVVFLSMVFWGWVWGPVGMVLSVPLTMLMKIMLEHSDDLKWLAVMLGSGTESPKGISGGGKGEKGHGKRSSGA